LVNAAALDDQGNPKPIGSKVSVYDMEKPLKQVSICTMLPALAAENAMKGLVAAQGRQPRFTHHLRQLATDSGAWEIMVADRDPEILSALLERAEASLTWASRYPQPKEGPANHRVGGNDHIQMHQLAVQITRLLAVRLTAEP